MKTIGMIGGVSWESTVLYYKLINESVRHQLGGLTSAKLMINSLNYQEIVNLENDNDWEKVTTILSHSAQVLEQSGADFIVLCCNTLHKVASKIALSTSIPFVHIADAAGFALNQAKITKVGLLGTQFTMEDGFYGDHLMHKFNVDVIVPDLEMRKKIDDIIYKELCVGKIFDESKDILLQAIHALTQQGASAILLGCTELGILIQPEDFHLPIFDTTKLHAEKIVSIALSDKT
ncbi:MAG: amino acid racemase [Legionellaceae bacterium]|nr:amino acid racemase [Legionellaceae bacterium]